jgi:beta-lactamase class A
MVAPGFCANAATGLPQSSPEAACIRIQARGATKVSIDQGVLNMPTHFVNRRWVIAAGTSLLLSASVAVRARSLVSIEKHLETIRTRIGGRVGVHALDTESGRRVAFDDASRYAMASTFKMLLAAAVLARVDRGELGLGQSIPFAEKDMLSHAPVTSKELERGKLTVQELCAAVVQVSDNPAANLLLKLLGGPEEFTKFVRTLDDTETRLDRYELELNSNIPGDPRDTTTPRAMVGSMQQVLLGKALSESSRNLLTEWLVSSTTGLQRIRAGVPKGWKVGDKTGTGQNGAVNDLAILWPAGRKPILMAVYLSDSKEKTEVLVSAHAEIASATISALGL